MEKDKVARVTITLSPELFSRAEQYARQKYMNRSSLFSLALEKFLNEVSSHKKISHTIEQISLTGDDLLAPRTIKYFKVGDSVPEQPELGTVKNIEFDESINSYIVEFEDGSPRKSVSGSSLGVMSHFTASASHYYITSYSEDVSNQKKLDKLQ